MTVKIGLVLISGDAVTCKGSRHFGLRSSEAETTSGGSGDNRGRLLAVGHGFEAECALDRRDFE
jgi:hypothetical protein